MDDTDGAGAEQAPGGAGVDGWVPLTAMPESVQRGLRSRIPFRRHRAMKGASRSMGETLGEGGPPEEGAGSTTA